MLYPLNTYNFICQLYLNNAGQKIYIHLTKIHGMTVVMKQKYKQGIMAVPEVNGLNLIRQYLRGLIEEIFELGGFWRKIGLLMVEMMQENLCEQPWPVWLSWLGIVLQSERLLVWFQVRTCAHVVGLALGQGMYERQPINVSLSYRCFSPSPSPSFLLSLKLYKGRKSLF